MPETGVEEREQSTGETEDQNEDAVCIEKEDEVIYANAPDRHMQSDVVLDASAGFDDRDFTSESPDVMEPPEDMTPPDCEDIVFIDDFGHHSHRVPQDIKPQTDIDDEEEKKKIGLSVSLHEELRMAILKKADEHRAREAKALHVTEQEIAPHFLCDTANNSNSKVESEKQEEKRKAGNKYDMRREEDFVTSGRLENMMSLTSVLASCAAEKGKAMNMNQSEESFGCDQEDEEGSGSEETIGPPDQKDDVLR